MNEMTACRVCCPRSTPASWYVGAVATKRSTNTRTSVMYLVGLLLAACHALTSTSPGASDVACLREGEGDSALSRREVSRPCCPGLDRVRDHESSPTASGDCIPSKGGRETCVQCGDGRCGLGEDSCNCEKDCPTASGGQL